MPKKPTSFLDPTNLLWGAMQAYNVARSAYNRRYPKKPSAPTAPKQGRKPKSGLKAPTKTRAKAGYMSRSADKSKSSYSKSYKSALSGRILSALSGTNIYEGAFPLRIQATSGRQAADSFLIADSYPINVMLDQINIPSNSSKKIYVDNIYACIEVANCSAAPVRAAIYDLHYKVDIATTAVSNSMPEDVWNTGEVEEGDPLGSSNVMSYPSRVSRFNRYYTIGKKTDLTLMPGENHTHKIYYAIHKWFKKQDVLDYCRLAGKTMAVMFSVQGTPADNTGTTDVSGAKIDASGNLLYPALTQVSTSAAALNLIMKIRYTYRFMDDIDDDVRADTNTLAVLPSVDIMNQVGTVVPGVFT